MASGLTLTILGCSGGYAGAGGACSGYLVRSETTSVWLDAGPGTLANLQRHIDIDALDAIVLSHEHPDHWRDIDGLYVAYAYGERRPRQVAVYAPAGVRELTYFDTDRLFTWHTTSDATTEVIGDLTVSFSRTDHGPETLAVRVEAGGRALAYSADTGPGWSFAAFGQPVDVALCEATLTADREGSVQHLSARQAAAAASAGGAEKLIVTHVWPETDPHEQGAQAAAAFAGEVAVAAIGDEYAV